MKNVNKYYGVVTNISFFEFHLKKKERIYQKNY